MTVSAPWGREAYDAAGYVDVRTGSMLRHVAGNLELKGKRAATDVFVATVTSGT